MSSNIKGLVGKKMTKTVKFIGEDVKITKLSVAEVLDIQDRAKVSNEDQESGFELLKKVIKMSVEGADELTDEDFNTFPMDELSKLSNEIMKFSGIAGEQGK
jgi:transcriptional regulator of met regulon